MGKFHQLSLSLHTAAPSFEYYMQLRCQCKVKRKIPELWPLIDVRNSFFALSLCHFLADFLHSLHES